jgi:hypothetical protein
MIPYIMRGMDKYCIKRLLPDYDVVDNPPHGAKDYNDLLRQKS